MIRSVHDGDARVGVAEMFAKRQPAKARTEHGNVNSFGPVHGTSLAQMQSNVTREWELWPLPLLDSSGLVAGVSRLRFPTEHHESLIKFQIRPARQPANGLDLLRCIEHLHQLVVVADFGGF